MHARTSIGKLGTLPIPESEAFEVGNGEKMPTSKIGCTPRGSCNRMFLRILEGFLEGSLKEVLLRRVLRRHLVRISVGTGVLRRVLRRGAVIEGAEKALRRQKRALSQSTTPFACTLQKIPDVLSRSVNISY